MHGLPTSPLYAPPRAPTTCISPFNFYLLGLPQPLHLSEWNASFLLNLLNFELSRLRQMSKI